MVLQLISLQGKSWSRITRKIAEPDQVEVLIQIDRQAQGLIGLLNEAMEMDKRFVRLRIHERDASMGAQALSGQLAQTIRHYL